MAGIARRATLTSLLVAVQALSGLAYAVQDEVFPRPAALEDAVRFWVRVYTEIDTQSGFLHDSQHLDVVYGTVDLPAELGSRGRQQHIEKAKTHYQNILLKLASGKRHGLAEDEARVLRLWPEDVNKVELRSAARRIRFQLGQSNRFREGLVRSGAWLPFILKTFADMGLPLELAYLPHVESSFNPRAFSHAAAAGLWQFTRHTGRRFLHVDHVVDERMDPFLSTVAAARLLKENYAETGSWPTAITAYNHGVHGMKRAISQLGTHDMAEIVRRYKSKSFGFASRNFYVSFLAALEVERHAEQYFGQFQRDPVEPYDIVHIDAYVSLDTLSRVLDVDREVLKAMNPALRAPIWNSQKLIPSGYPLRVPGSPETVHAALAAIPPHERHRAQTPDVTHKVAPGETLSHIAGRYRVSVKSLVQLNGLRSPHQIRAGQNLRLPQAADTPLPALATRNAAGFVQPSVAFHTVGTGDTLSRIAKRYGTSERDLAALNGLANKHRIYVGQTLKLAADGTATPAPDVYLVRRGDTLSRIARSFGLRETDVAAINGISNQHRIYVGQRLRLTPAASRVEPGAGNDAGSSTIAAASAGADTDAAVPGETPTVPFAAPDDFGHLPSSRPARVFQPHFADR